MSIVFWYRLNYVKQIEFEVTPKTETGIRLSILTRSPTDPGPFLADVESLFHARVLSPDERYQIEDGDYTQTRVGDKVELACPIVQYM